MGQCLERLANSSIDCWRASRLGAAAPVDVPFVLAYARRRCC